MPADHYGYFDDFFANVYNVDVLAPERVGEAAVRASFEVADDPHNIGWTHPDQVNTALLDFLGR